jgi:uncharacterized protein YlzI (FlbEa/FlbD family)
MSILTRRHGGSVAVNCDLIERVEVASETVAAVVDKVRDFRASVVKLYLVPSPDPDA